MTIIPWKRDSLGENFAPKPALADEAVSEVGHRDHLRAESIARLEDLVGRLESNIRREMDALKIVQSALARERAADTDMAFAAVEDQVDAALDAIDSADLATAENDTTEAPVPARRRSKKLELQAAE